MWQGKNTLHNSRTLYYSSEPSLQIIRLILKCAGFNIFEMIVIKDHILDQILQQHFVFYKKHMLTRPS